MTDFKNHNIDFSGKKNHSTNLKKIHSRVLSFKEFFPAIILLIFIFTSILIPSNINFIPIIAISGAFFWGILFLQYAYKFFKNKYIIDMCLSLLYFLFAFICASLNYLSYHP